MSVAARQKIALLGETGALAVVGLVFAEDDVCALAEQAGGSEEPLKKKHNRTSGPSRQNNRTMDSVRKICPGPLAAGTGRLCLRRGRLFSAMELMGCSI